MGCDIHFVIERQITKFTEAGEEKPAGGWVGVYCTDWSPLLLTRETRLLTRETRLEEKGDMVAGVFDRWPAWKGRNYAFFAALAGVRGDGPDSKGLPSDLSGLAQVLVSRWEGDGHSHSYDTLEAFTRIWLLTTHAALGAKSVARKIAGDGGDPLIPFVAGLYGEEIQFYRVVYWFDN